jgi:ubiquinone/menaquinone biosynthesis C-methylase UbiE
VKVHYDSIASVYDRRFHDNDYSGVEAALMAWVGDPDGPVLEVGCGTGQWLRRLDKSGVRIAGVDASSKMLERARENAPRALLAHAVAERLPWLPGTFSRVFFINAFHHFDDKLQCLTEARRVLRPGGQLMNVGLDPHTGLDHWYIYDYFESALETDRRRYPAAAQIQAWLQEVGFENVRTDMIQHLPVTVPARAAIEQGRLGKTVTSQLAVLGDEDYRRGLHRITVAMESAERRGESLELQADLRLYATLASAPRNTE